jgi:hypothetical protein
VTVSSSYSLDYTRDELLKTAFQLAGVVDEEHDPSAADYAMASRFLNLELMALQAEGVVLRSVERTTLTLVSGTATYTLPADTVDVQFGPNDEVGTIVDSDSKETSVLSMSRHEYLGITDKTSAVTGRPSRAYVEKLASVTVTLWPVPDSTAVSLRYARVRLLRDGDTGAVTMDLHRKWLKFVTYASAANIARAKSLGLDAVGDLQNQAERMKAVCLADDSQRGKIRLRVSHPGARW